MQLLELFHELTVRPQNAMELKGLILQLAVHGKLTANWREENPNVEPASELLRRIQKEKEKLVKEKKLKKEKPLPSLNLEEVLGDIPNTWEYVRLGEIGDWGAGATPLRSNGAFYDGQINWFKSGELNNGVIDYDSEEKITDLALSKTSVRLNQPGDVLIAMYGATIGKTGLLAVSGTTNQAVCACTPFAGILSEFLHTLLKALKNNFMDQGEGGAQPNISRIKIRNQIFQLPPFEEQKAIVKIVESLFKEVEQLEALTEARVQLKEDFATSALRQLTEGNTSHEWSQLQAHFPTFFDNKANIKKLRESILQLAVQGKLTANWRAARVSSGVETAPASELLKRIQKEKEQLIKEKKIKKEKPLPAISEDEIPYELPEGWVWCRFQEIFDIRDGTHDSPKDSVNKITYPLVTSKNFKDGTIDFDAARRISEEDYLKVIQRSRVDTGDILFSMIGGNIGNQVVVGEFTEYAIKNVALFKHYNYGHPAPGFLKLFSQFIAKNLQNEAAGGAQPFVSLKFLRSIVISLPPIEEQKALVEKVNQLMTYCDELEEQVKQCQRHAEQLMQSVLREVFEGEPG